MTIYQGTIFYGILSNILTRNGIDHVGEDLVTIINRIQVLLPYDEVCEVFTQSYKVIGFNQ